MAAVFKTCPICMTANSRLADTCQHCGSDLTNVHSFEDSESATEPRYTFERGETDLLEKSVSGSNLVRVLGIFIILMFVGVILFSGFLVILAIREMNFDQAPTEIPETPIVIALATVTPSRPTATYTPWPSNTPLPSPTPSPAPCIQRVNAGDTLIALVSHCGHRHQDILSIVVDRNGLISAEQLQIGQEIIIPWPTPTQAGGSTNEQSTVEEALVFPVSTLPAGVMWHRVSFGEDIVSIASRYGANIEIMSQLNPEVSFSQCDFGLVYGGDSCIVQIFEGQQLRVPAPTPIPSATPQPVFIVNTQDVTLQENVPYSLRPGDGVVYRADEIVTLRWLSSGTLGPDQIFIVEIIDETTSQSYLAETREMQLSLPENWQGKDGQRHMFRWRVGLRTGETSDHTIWTEARTFVWLGRQAET